MKILCVTPRENFFLYVESEDGQTGLFDVALYLEHEAFAPLRDPAEFQRVRNGGYYIEWPCGADLSADTIEARWSVNRQETEASHLPAFPWPNGGTGHHGAGDSLRDAAP